MSEPLLEVTGLVCRIEGFLAVDDAGFAVGQGTVHALIGPNGAGKTTLFNALSGLLPPAAGAIRFAGRDVTRLPAHARTALGLGRTFQNLRLFGAMSVLENVMTGMHPRLHVPWPAALLRLPAGRREERRAKDEAMALLRRLGLEAAADRPAGSLAYGDQRRLEIARALAARPSLLLLDEPAAGMNPSETAALAALIAELRSERLTVLLVEHDMRFVMGLSDRVTVLNFGRKIAEGAPAEVRADPRVIAAYLGRRASGAAA